MTVKFLDIAAQHAEIASELRDAYETVLQRSSFVLGQEVEAFEAEFAAYCGARYSVGVGNGCDAIELALRGMGVKEGDEVIVPAFTFAATWFAVSRVGARPVPVEVMPGTALIDPSKIEAAITDKTRAVVPVHLFGQPADMSEITEIAERRKLLILEDAAQAQGSTYGARKTGSLGDAAAFSFYPGKNLGALGDAGAIVTDNAELARDLRRLRNYGSERKYNHGVVAGNTRLDELQAGFLRVKLRHLDRWNAARRAIADRYTDILGRARLPALTLPEESRGRRTNHHLYVIQIGKRDAIQRRLGDLGIETLVHYPIPVHRQAAYQGVYDHAQLQVTDHLSATVLSLPIGPMMKQAEVDRVCEALSLALREIASG